MKNNSAIYLTRGALISALYVALTYAAALLGLSSGVIQFRISEMLCILPIFMPEAIVGLTLGCVLANFLTGAVIWDVVFGALATLIGALGARALRNIPEKVKFLATLPTLFANAIIVPFVLIYAYGVPDAYPYLMLTVGAGELACATVAGTVLYFALKKSPLIK